MISSNQINNCRLYKQPLSLINMCLKSPLFPIRTKVNSLEMGRIWSHTRENDLFTLEKGAFSCVSCYFFLNCKLVEMFHIACENNTGIYFQMFVSFAYLIVNGLCAFSPLNPNIKPMLNFLHLKVPVYAKVLDIWT